MEKNVFFDTELSRLNLWIEKTIDTYSVIYLHKWYMRCEKWWIYCESEDCAYEEHTRTNMFGWTFPINVGASASSLSGAALGSDSGAQSSGWELQIVLIDKSNHHVFGRCYIKFLPLLLNQSTISFSFSKHLSRQRECFHIRACEALRGNPKTFFNHYRETYLWSFGHSNRRDTNYFGNKNGLSVQWLWRKRPKLFITANPDPRSFELALSTNSAEERQRLMTFVVVGSGATGMELAGALAEMKKKFVIAGTTPT